MIHYYTLTIVLDGLSLYYVFVSLFILAILGYYPCYLSTDLGSGYSSGLLAYCLFGLAYIQLVTAFVDDIAILVLQCLYTCYFGFAIFADYVNFASFY